MPGQSASTSPIGLRHSAYLPYDLWHVQVLRDGKLKDGSDSLKVFDSTFDLSPLDPGGAERWVVLYGQKGPEMPEVVTYSEELLVEFSDPIELSETHLQFNVASEEFGFWAHSDTCSQNFSSSRYVLSADLKVGV